MTSKTNTRLNKPKEIGLSALVISAICMLLATVLLFTFGINNDELNNIWLAIFVVVLFGVLPAGIVLYLGEFFLKVTLNLWGKQLPNFYAIIYGLIVGLTLVSIAEFALWIRINSILPWYHVSLLEFLFPENLADLPGFTINVNPFFIPIIIDIALSSYIGWKINKTKSLETIFPTKE